MNNLAISLKKFFTNKNTVTIIGVVAVLAILYFLYSKQIAKETKKENVPVAEHTISPLTYIESGDITHVEVAHAAKPEGVILVDSQIIGKYTGENVTIPKGGMFTKEQLVTEDELPGPWLTLVDTKTKGEMPYYFSVNVTTTFGNSIQPDEYVDMYIKTYDEKEEGKLIYTKLYENLKVLAVTEGSGKNVFRSTNDIGTPSFLNFGIPVSEQEIIKKAELLNGTDIDLIIIPQGGKNRRGQEKELRVNTYMRNYIAEKTVEVERPTESTDENNNTSNSNTNNNVNSNVTNQN